MVPGTDFSGFPKGPEKSRAWLIYAYIANLYPIIYNK
jgi:hypothetical protein